MPSSAAEAFKSKQQQQRREHEQLKRNPKQSKFREQQQQQQRKLHPVLRKPEQQQQAQAAEQQNQKRQTKHQNRCQCEYILKGFFPLLAFSLLLGILNNWNCSATSIVSMTTATDHVEAPQSQKQGDYTHPYRHPLPQQSHTLQQQQHQNKPRTSIEDSSVSSNQSFQSLSHIDAIVRAAESEVKAKPDMGVMFKDPAFDFGMPRNITARTGQAEAAIKCRVIHLRDKSVSWIRKRDLHILTVATSTYTSDKRFQVTDSKDSREWTLHVKSPQPRDSGIYECQVNTEPKMSMAFQLNIIVTPPDARAVISGPLDQHFKVGSAIIISCIVEQPSFKDIGPIYWYRGEQMLTPIHNVVDEVDAEATDRTAAVDVDHFGALGSAAAAAAVEREVQEKTEEPREQNRNDIETDFATRIAMESQLGDTLKSRLRISNARMADTGNYTCQPTTASGASVMIHVINDESPAAMQKSAAPGLQTLDLVGTLLFYGLSAASAPLLL